MPNGRRSTDHQYDSLWCRAEHKRIDKKIEEICGPDGYLTRVHKRIDNLWYLIASVGIIGLANLIVSIIRTAY